MFYVYKYVTDIPNLRIMNISYILVWTTYCLSFIYNVQR